MTTSDETMARLLLQVLDTKDPHTPEQLEQPFAEACRDAGVSPSLFQGRERATINRLLRELEQRAQVRRKRERDRVGNRGPRHVPVYGWIALPIGAERAHG